MLYNIHKNLIRISRKVIPRSFFRNSGFYVAREIWIMIVDKLRTNIIHLLINISLKKNNNKCIYYGCIKWIVAIIFRKFYSKVNSSFFIFQTFFSWFDFLIFSISFFILYKFFCILFHAIFLCFFYYLFSINNITYDFYSSFLLKKNSSLNITRF